uniref:Uncharacterized protein n=1 Tax=Anopheles arabiensis TaxID=7173 RepID=A0A182IF36_ANOAR
MVQLSKMNQSFLDTFKTTYTATCTCSGEIQLSRRLKDRASEVIHIIVVAEQLVNTNHTTKKMPRSGT